jgi:hypothetical protein
MNLAPLVYRLIKGSALTATEHDRNLTRIRDFVNALSALLEATLNPDGTLVDGAVDRTAVLADRIVTNPKLWWLFDFYGVATGTNDYVVPVTTVAATWPGWTDGFKFIARFPNANTRVGAPCTIDLDLGGGALGAAKDLKKLGPTQDLVVGDILANQIYVCVYDGTNDVVQIVAPVTPPISSFAESSAIVLPAAGGTTTWAHGLGTLKNFKGFLRCNAADAGYSNSPADDVPIDAVLSNDGSKNFESYRLINDVTGSQLRVTGNTNANWNIVHKTNGTNVAFTPGNWRIILQAYA